jgi:hypothetical protein
MRRPDDRRLIVLAMPRLLVVSLFWALMAPVLVTIEKFAMVLPP